MRYIDAWKARPEGSICSYSGYLSVPTLTPQAAEQVQSTARSAGLEVDVGSKSIEFAYDGRDSNRFIVKFLQQVASAIGDASGEIRCEITTDEPDPYFEFYKISGGHLRRQMGVIVRQQEEDVSMECS